MSLETVERQGGGGGSKNSKERKGIRKGKEET